MIGIRVIGGPVDQVRYRRDHRALEDVANTHLHTELRSYSGCQPHGGERMPAEIEEVVVGRQFDVAEPQHLRHQFADGPFGSG